MEWKIILFVILSVCSLGFTAANGFVLVAFLKRRQGGSMIPLLGGLTGLAATLLAPWHSVRQFWWLPLFIDAGTFYWLVTVFKSSKS